MAGHDVTRGSSPYSTGGGGVILEHEFAAVALASVLLAEPVVGLGNDFTARRVGLQQERYSPVDDVFVEGECDGQVRRLRVACRRRPTIGPSDRSTVKLFADFVAALLAERDDLEQGTLRLGLAVAGPYGPASELAVLADLARRQPDRATFAEAVRAPGAYSRKVRKRLEDVDGLVAEALQLVTAGGAAEDPETVTWELLRSLYVIQAQLEGDAAPGRTELVTRLQTLTGTPGAADKLRQKLVEIASQGALRGGLFDRAMLRRELAGFGALGASRDFAAAKKQVETLEAELRRRTQRSLPVPGSAPPLVLERKELRSKLTIAISDLPPGGVVIVHGEPGAGKSALALSVADAIRDSGGAVLAMSLRDLPPKVVEFRSTIGLAPDDLIAAAPSSEPSVLLLDGAEVLQETEAQAAGALIEACRATGRRTVLVARDDALGVVRELARTAGGDESREFTVPPLSDEEIAEVTRAVPALNRLASDDRSKWLLRRIGLIELLLQSAERGAELPRSLASEADVFGVVWSSLVRQNERRTASVSPDDREAAAVSIAENLLKGTSRTSTGAAFATLRSDGILLPRGPTSPWQRGDEFASDVIRDFAVARLLFMGGLDVLAESAAPRWAVRAARIYAQAKIAEALESGGNAVADQWEEVRREFAQLAADHGARWREVPWEALLTAGWVEDVLNSLKLDLADKREALDEAIRCVNLRFSDADACDPFIAAPLVRRVVDGGGIERVRIYADDPLIDFVALWLRGIARLEAASADVSALRPLRRRVRDALMRRPPECGEHTRLECLGLFGDDATPESHNLLRHVASATPASLGPVVESFDVALSLAKHDVELLAQLTEAYYIEQPTDGYLGSHLMDDGIRDHEGGGLTTPLAAWYRGPFLWLLRANWQLGLGVIDRMLDRGARTRVEVLNALTNRSGERANTSQLDMGISLDLFGYGPRMYIGDAHVWNWYRGSSLGPYPCMSALFALEMVLDEIVQAGIALRPIVKSLLRNATTLATPGLAYGFLVRHIDRVTDELDDFLAVPEVWRLEFGRALSEGRLHVQGPDPANRIGKERRRWTPREVAIHLVLEAATRGDEEAIERLRGVGRALIERAGGDDAPPEVVQWAAHLDRDSYEMETEGNRLIVQVHPPQDVVDALAEAQARSEKLMQLYGLLSRYHTEQVIPYRRAVAAPSDKQNVVEDVALARQLQAEIPEQPLDQVRMALAGLAATVVVRRIDGLKQEDVCWALSVLVDSALHPYVDEFPIGSAIFPDGADRKAALALPRALPLVGDCEDFAKKDVVAAVKACTASIFIEVREHAAEACRQVFSEGCRTVFDGRCWHEIAWEAVEHGARYVRLGAADEWGSRQITAITGDLVGKLAKTATEDLMLTHIAPAAAATINAARDGSCVREHAVPLRDALISAYARAACHWANENYAFRDEQQGAFASAVLGWASSEGSEVIMQIAKRFKESSAALADFLNALTLVATYERAAVPLLQDVWPRLMRLGLDVLRTYDGRERYAKERLIQHLVPDPRPSIYAGNLDEVLKVARANWLTLDAVSPYMDEWLSNASVNQGCVDALVGFLQAQPKQDQLQPGLNWVRTLIIDEDGRAETSGFTLMSWLTDLRSTPSLRGGALVDYRAIVDGLALAGFSDATALQKIEE